MLCDYVQADEPLGTFLDYCTYGHMIDNVVLLVTGTLHERDVTVSCSCTTSPFVAWVGRNSQYVL